MHGEVCLSFEIISSELYSTKKHYSSITFTSSHAPKILHATQIVLLQYLYVTYNLQAEENLNLVMWRGFRAMDKQSQFQE